MSTNPELWDHDAPASTATSDLRADGRFLEALAAAEAAVVAAVDSGDPERATAARIEAALAAGELGGPEAAVALLHDVGVPAGAPRAAASLSFHLGALYRLLDEPAAALARLDDAAERYRSLGDAAGEARTLAERAAVRSGLDDWAGAVADATAVLAAVGAAPDSAGAPGGEAAGRRRRGVIGRSCVVAARTLQDAGHFSNSDPARPGALQALEQAAGWLAATGDEAYAVSGYAHYRHVEATVRIPAAVAARLALPVEPDVFGRTDPAEAGEWAASALARAGQGRLAGAALADLGHSLRDRARAVSVLRRAADIHRNIGHHSALAADLADVAALSAAAGDVATAADAIELGVRAARRSATPVGAVHADLLSAAEVLDDVPAPRVWLGGHHARDVAQLCGRSPGPAGEITLALAPGVEVTCDVADGSLIRLHQSVPADAGLLGALDPTHQRRWPGTEVLELAVPATSAVLDAVGGLCAVAAARRHGSSDDAVAAALLGLQWATAHSHPALDAVVDPALRRRRWEEAAAGIGQLGSDDHSRLFALLDDAGVAAAVERALLGAAVVEPLDALDRLSERAAPPVAELVGATSRALGGHRSAAEEESLRRSLTGQEAGDDQRVGPSVGEARRLACLAALAARRGQDATTLWEAARGAWAPHSSTAAALCDLYAGAKPAGDAGLAFFAIEVRRRLPAAKVRTWDGHLLGR